MGLWECINDCMLALQVNSSLDGWNTIFMEKYIVVKVWMAVMRVSETLTG